MSDRLKQAEEEYAEAVKDEIIAYDVVRESVDMLTRAHALYKNAREKAIIKMRKHYDAMQELKS